MKKFTDGPVVLMITFLTLLFSCNNPSDLQNKEIEEDSMEQQRVENSGIFAIWYGNNTEVLSLPMVIGGQVVVQWKDIETAKNSYDFSVISAKTAELRSMGKLATLQINGNQKPDYLFDEVPWVEEKLSHQIGDSNGSLMYWHPKHVNAYKNLLKALSGYLSDHGKDFLGIRMNYNPFGTEHSHLANETFRDASIWNYPEGVEQGINWSTEVAKEYQNTIRNTYFSEIAPHTRVFVRNGINTEDEPEFDQYFRKGTLSLFQTSSESEPRSSGVERQYQNFYTYCRSGLTTAYAEPWASSMGHHGIKNDDRVESMPQWFYWRMLIDLHCGVSHIAVYYDDLVVALRGTYSYRGILFHDDAVAGTNYRQEFNEALNFASKYAGYHAAPLVSPGAWVAFRGNDLVRNENGISEANRKLVHMNGDYDFLMKRQPDQSIPVEFIGHPDTRFGSWARKLPSGEKMVLEPDPLFIESLTAPKVKLTWYDGEQSSGKVNITAGEHSFFSQAEGDGKWKVATFELPDNDFRNIEIQALEGDIILHMLEIVR